MCVTEEEEGGKLLLLLFEVEVVSAAGERSYDVAV